MEKLLANSFHFLEISSQKCKKYSELSGWSVLFHGVLALVECCSTHDSRKHVGRTRRGLSQKGSYKGSQNCFALKMLSALVKEIRAFLLN